MRKQINYSDETNNDDGLFNIAELDDFDNNADENDYSAVEVPKPKKIVERQPEREWREREPKDKLLKMDIDIEELLAKPKTKMEDEIFEEDG